MDKRPSFSIKYKIIALMTISLISAITFYTFYATNLFQEDKKAYIYENILATSTSYSNEISSTIENLGRDIEILEKLVSLKRYKKVEELISNEKNITAILTSHFQFTTDDTLKYEKLKEILEQNKKRKIFRYDNYLVFKNAYFIELKQIFNSLDSNKIYKSIVFNEENEILFSNLNDLKNLEVTLKESTQINTVKTISYNNEKFLYSGSSTRKTNIRVVNVIDYNKAFSVTDFLIKKSILFGLFILFFISAIAILFSKTITSPIEKLFDASKELAKGNFNIVIEKLSNDEIGHLGNAFNFMTGEIKKYMEHMKEKIRLENEIQVAKLVQDNFFPRTEIIENNYDIMAFNTPATECGGDWWSYHETNNKLIVIIADATGHGIPAAFLTSSINTAFNSIKYLIENGDFDITPSSILNFLNKSLSLTKTDVLLTSFVCVFDLEKSTLSYSNASHLDALYIPHKDLSLEKSDILPLIEAKGGRLGHKTTSKYEDAVIPFNKFDTIILKTDGIIECVNDENKSWGVRRFLKVLTENQTHDLLNLRNKIIEELMRFCKKEIFEDDLTLVCIKVKK